MILDGEDQGRAIVHYKLLSVMNFKVIYILVILTFMKFFTITVFSL